MLKKMWALLKKGIKFTLTKYYQIFKYALNLSASIAISALVMLSGVYFTLYLLQFLGLYQALPITPISPFEGNEPIILVSIALSIGIIEETMFRYLFYDCLFRRFMELPNKWAIVISSLFFGLAHFGNAMPGYEWYTVPQVVGAAGLAFWLVYIYNKFGLHFAILTHAGYDLMLMLLEHYHVKNTALILAVVYGIGAFLLIFLVIRYLKRKRAERELRKKSRYLGEF